MNDALRRSQLISHEIASVNMFECRRSVFLHPWNKTLGNRLVVVTMFKARVGFTLHN